MAVAKQDPCLMDNDAWIESQGVDNCSRRVFQSLSEKDQNAVRLQGTLRGANVHNPSGLLMSRIRKVYSAFIELSAKMKEEVAHRMARRQARELLASPRRSSIAVVIRGESNRSFGGRSNHGAMVDFSQFRRVCNSIVTHLVEELERDYDVQVFVDVKIVNGGDEEIKAVLLQCFGRRLTEARTHEELRGLNQVGSVMSTWDSLVHWIEQRPLKATCVGCYVLRAEAMLLSSGLAKWPKDKVCFLWHTTSRKSQETANDMFFYVAREFWQPFRASLKDNWTPNDLHWLSTHPALARHTWFEFDIHHPSTTDKKGNPRYVLLDRATTEDSEAGKFHEVRLRGRSDYQLLHDSFLASVWSLPVFWSSAIVNILMHNALRSTELLTSHTFKTHWFASGYWIPI